VDAGRAAISGDFAAIMPHLWWVIGYALAALLAAVLVFRKKMLSDKA
jgi:ABC-2 type transport system permease protein